jgi:hypothetical protein
MYETAKGLILSCFSAPLDTLWAGAAPGLQRELKAGGIVAEDGSLDLGRIRFGLHDLNVWSSGKEIRTVLVYQDPGWTFFEKGPALEFEDGPIP